MSKITFAPKSESQFQQEEKERLESFLWGAGEYGFEITKAIGKISAEKFDAEGNYKSGGKPMIELRVTLFKDDGKTQAIFDWLNFEGQFAFKLRHAAYACGLGQDYENGAMDPKDFEGKTGIAKVGVKKAQGDYPAGNSIQDYVLDAAASVQYGAVKTEKARASVSELDDDLPF